MTKRLDSGQKAPYFEADVWDGSKVVFEQFKGKKIWLAFFRYASCPLCNLRVRKMIRLFDEFAEPCLQIIAIFQSPPASMAEYVGKQNPPFPLISDPDEKLYKLYGLESSWWGLFNPGNLPTFTQALRAGFSPGRMEGTVSRIPGDFLIDESGIIQTAFYGEKIGDHISFDRIFNFAICGINSAQLNEKGFL